MTKLLSHYKTGTYANYQDLLKTIAIIAVFIDHTGLFFIHDLTLRAIGRMAMPIFCFFVGYNYTRPNKTRLVLFGSIITAFYALCFDFYLINLLIVMYGGHWYLYFINKYNLKSYGALWVQLILLLGLSQVTAQYFEYGTLSTCYILLGYLNKNGIKDYKMMIFITLGTIIFTNHIFNWPTKFYSALSASVLLLDGFLLWICNHNTPTKLDLRLISRNSIFLYFINVVGSIICFMIFKT